MNLATAQELHNAVANLFQPQGALDHGPVIRGHSDRVGIAEKIRRVQHIDMKGVTLDPLAAIEEAAQQPHRGVDADSQGALDGVHRTHLVSHGANATDPRGDVGSLGKVASAKKGFEQSRRLVDLQFYIRDAVTHELYIQGTLAFYAGQRVDSDCFCAATAHLCSQSSLALRNCHDHALNPRNARTI